MRDEHLTEEELEQIIADADEIYSRLLLHHLAVCSDCYAVGGFILDLFREGLIGPDLDTLSLRLAFSRREAPRLLRGLRAVPPGQQVKRVLREKRYRSWGLCELLCRESEREATRDPKGAVALARLAVGVAGALEEGQPAEAAWLDELRAYALAHLGHARRALGRRHGAEAAFRSALALWAPAYEDVGDVLDYEAHFLELLACEEVPEIAGPAGLLPGARPRGGETSQAPGGTSFCPGGGASPTGGAPTARGGASTGTGERAARSGRRAARRGGGSA